MKNLHLCYAASTAHQKPDDAENSVPTLKNALSFCVDSFNALTYFAFSNEIICLNQELKVERRFDCDTSEFG